MKAVKLVTISYVLVAVFIVGCDKSTQNLETALASTKETVPTDKHAQTSKFTAQTKYDGPFGLKIGLTREQVLKIIPKLEITEDRPEFATSSTVPIPHPDFDIYTFQFSEKSGLCSIGAIGKDIRSGDSGAEIREAFDELDSAISVKYGKGKKFDYANDRSNSNEFWMLQLLQKNRVLSKFWDKDEGSVLPDDISSIAINVKSKNIGIGYFTLKYEFSNFDDCVAENKTKKNKGL